jgi:hypothetical protein
VLTAGTESPAYDLEGPNGNVNSLFHAVTIRDQPKKTLDSQKKIMRERRRVAHNTQPIREVTLHPIESLCYNITLHNILESQVLTHDSIR